MGFSIVVWFGVVCWMVQRRRKHIFIQALTALSVLVIAGRGGEGSGRGRDCILRVCEAVIG
jgi:hypothetical protein